MPKMLNCNCAVDALRGKMQTISSTVEVEKKVDESPKLILQLGAEWCGPCKALKPKVESLADANGGIEFAYVDVDSASEFANANRVMSIPTVIAYAGGVKVGTSVGSSEKGVRDLIDLLNK